MARKTRAKPKPITFELSPKQLAALRKKGMLRNKSGEVRVKYANGRLYVVKHKVRGRFVASNAAFA